MAGTHAEELRERDALLPDDDLDRGAVGPRLDRAIAADAPAHRPLAGDDRLDRRLVAAGEQDVAVARVLEEVAPGTALTTFISAPRAVPPRVGREMTTLPFHFGSLTSALSDFGASPGLSVLVL